MPVLGRWVAVYAGILLVSLACSYVQAIVLQVTGQKILSAMRQDIFTHIESLSQEQLNNIPVGKLVTRVSNDPNHISFMFTNILVTLVKNVMVMGVVPGGFLGICIAKDTKISYSDADMFSPSVSKKDLLIRNPSMDVAAMIVNGLGFNSFNLSWSELYNALQTGVVNGAYGAGAGTVYTDLRDVVSSFYDFRYLMEMMAMYASKSSLEKLPADLAQIVVDCAVAEQELAFDEYEEFEKEGYQQLKDYGIDVIYPTDEEMAAMASEMRDIVWPQLYDLFGEDTMTGIRAQVESLK